MTIAFEEKFVQLGLQLDNESFSYYTMKPKLYLFSQRKMRNNFSSIDTYSNERFCFPTKDLKD